MPILEVAIYLLILISLYMLVRKEKVQRFIVYILVTLVLLLLLAHFIFGFIRWQLYLLYIAIPLLIGLLFVKYHLSFSLKPWIRRLTLSFVFITVIGSFLLILSFPLYEIPEPTGDYDIGTRIYTIEDRDRIENYGDEPFRRFMIQVWYPAQTIEGYKQAPWLEGGKTLSRALAEDNYLPGFVLDHTSKVMSNAYYDAPISLDQATYPIVVISHGWRGFRTLHTDFAEELASQGYIVISIDHTYGSVATVFDTDDVAYLNLDALEPRTTNPNFTEDSNLLVRTYSEDIIKTLDYLETLNTNPSSFFYTHLDLDKIGLLGHSTGGGAGVAAALEDTRVDAIFGLDPWVEPLGQTTLSDGLDIPSVYVRSEAWESLDNNNYLYPLINHSQQSYLYQINGTTHYDFAMVYMYSPLTKYIGITGSVDSDYLTGILKTMITDFFDDKLIGDQDTKLDISDWDEVVYVDTD